jgi:hypothetical protein
MFAADIIVDGTARGQNAMTSSLSSSRISRLLDRLHAESELVDPPLPVEAEAKEPSERTALLDQAFIPVSAETGRFEPALAPGALIVADDLNLFPDVLKPYVAYVRDAASGYVSVEIPIGDAMELSVRVR